MSKLQSQNEIIRYLTMKQSLKQNESHNKIYVKFVTD